ncbi:MAG TPA: hypothetical protein VH309_03905 [Elusimicrobiota bacterium]|jgi:hypothetical protein|nr:hypothetical protein [Elusimicrobiota bacterium]
MIAKDLMPWLFVNRKSAWTPFAKVRCEGNACRWLRTARPAGKKKAPDPKGSRAFLGAAGA